MPDPSTSLLLKGEPPLVHEFLELAVRIDRENPAPADVQALRRMLDAHPDLWRLAGDLSRAAVIDIVNRLGAGPVVAESLKHSREALMEELGYPLASPLERLLIEQVALCWLHFHVVQLEHTAATGGSITIVDADGWERRLSAAQRRYLGACDALARIRKLALTTPALQVNIAAQGGQQVNLLGG